MQYIITPNRFNKFEKLATPVFALLSFALLIIGSYSALINSPADYQQGEYVRMMYVHVPAAWLAMGIYFGAALASASYLIWKNPLSGIFLKCEIPIGATFALICLITGALWGRPVWGVYWVWDARLTSMLILLFIYIGLYLLYHSFEDEEKAARATSVLCLIGLVNLPVIRLSVKWWNTLHQPASVMRLAKPTLAPEILTPLMLMFAFFLSFFLLMLTISTKTEILTRKNKRFFMQNSVAER